MDPLDEEAIAIGRLSVLEAARTSRGGVDELVRAPEGHQKDASDDNTRYRG